METSNRVMSLQSLKSNRTIQIALASGSGFFLEGIRNILRDENCITILSEASNVKEVERHLIETKPDFLFLDNRTIKINIK